MKLYAITILMLTATLAPLTAQAGEVDQRLHDEHQRIAQGVRTGAISPRELDRLRWEGRALKRQEQAMRRAHGGHLTSHDRWLLNQELNRRSREIWIDKHN